MPEPFRVTPFHVVLLLGALASIADFLMSMAPRLIGQGAPYVIGNTPKLTPCPPKTRPLGENVCVPDSVVKKTYGFASAGNMARCKKENPGGCERVGILAASKCPAGFSSEAFTCTPEGAKILKWEDRAYCEPGHEMNWGAKKCVDALTKQAQIAAMVAAKKAAVPVKSR